MCVYSNTEQRASCYNCPVGYYCLQGAVNATECPAGHYCPAGTRHAYEYPCPKGTFNPYPNTDGPEDCNYCTPGQYCESRSNTGQYCESRTHTGQYCINFSRRPSYVLAYCLYLLANCLYVLADCLCFSRGPAYPYW